MADNNLQVTGIYASGNTIVKETATTNDITSFKVVDLEGPFDDNGNPLQYVEEGQVCVYIATLDKDVSAVDVKKVNWAMAYDENGDGDLKFEKIQGGRRYDKNRIWVYLQSKKATSLLTIHAYTGALPVNGSSITVSLDHKQYKADLKKGDRFNTPSNVTIVTDATTEIEDKEFEIKTGIRIHFLRPGFFEGDGHDSKGGNPNALGNQNNKLDHAHTNISLNNFHCHLTELVPGGYIYIIDSKKTTLEDSFEYYITPNQTLKRLPWYSDLKGEDIRSTFGARRAEKKITEHHYHLVEYIKDKVETPEVYVCYSPVQWSKKYFEKMLSNDQGLRDKRMIKVLCEPMQASEYNRDNETIFSYDGFSAFFKNDNAIGYNRLKNKRKRLHTYFSNHPEQKEDLFITLPDPVNAAREIADEVAHYMLNFKALVEAIQTGETQQEAYNRICTGGEAPYPESEYQSLYSLALTVYHMVYNDTEMIKKYDGGVPAPGGRWGELHEGEAYKEWQEWGSKSTPTVNNVAFWGYDGADPEKIKGILGVEARKKLREKITSFRDDLGDFLSHDDFKIPLDDYLHNTKERQLDGRIMFADLLDALYPTPYLFDRHLLLRKDYIDTDPWQEKIRDITNNELAANYKGGANASKAPDYTGVDPLFALVAPTLVFDEKDIHNAKKISVKIAKAIKKQISFLSNRYRNLFKTQGQFFNHSFTDFVFSKMNIQIGTESFFEVRNVELDDALNHLLKREGKTLDGNLVNTKTGRKHTKISGSVKLLQVKGKPALNMPVVEPIDTPKVNLQSKAAQIINSKAFTGVMAVIDVYNFGEAILKFGEGKIIDKEVANIVNTSIKLTESGLVFYKAMGGKTSLEEVIDFGGKKLGTRAVLLGAISSVATAVMCVWDATDAYNRRDTDATVALSLAALSFSVSAGVGIASFITGSTVAGPLGVICALVGTGFYIIGIMLADTPLETYFKNFLLSDDNTKFAINADESPMAYNRRLFTNKKLLMHDDDYYDTMMHPYDAEATLMNLIVCPHVKLEPLVEYRQIEVPKELAEQGVRSYAPDIKVVKSITAQLRFYGFFNNAKNIEVKAYFVRSGLRALIPGEKPPVLDINVVQVKDMLEARIDFKNQQVWLPSEFILAIRLEIDSEKDLYFPYNNRQEKAMYLAIKIPLMKIFGSYSDTWNEAPTFLAEDELFNVQNWN